MARGGNDEIVARGGRDLVCAGLGADVLGGGRGADRLFGGLDEDGSELGVPTLFGDVLRGGPGDDRLVPGLDRRPHQRRHRDALFWDWATHGVRVDLQHGRASGQGRDSFPVSAWQVRTSRHADVVDGSSGRDVIFTREGSDLVRGGAGNDDMFDGSAGDRDTLIGGSGSDFMTVDGGSDLQRGGPGNDRLSNTGDGPARMFAGPGNDFVNYLFVFTGRQVLSGGPGAADRVGLAESSPGDELGGTGSFDMATGQVTFERGARSGSMPATGFEQARIAGGFDTWLVRGTEQDDFVRAIFGFALRFEGRAGDDMFVASSGDDFFDGGPGTDTGVDMANEGNDTCVSVEVFRTSSLCTAPQP